MAKLTWSPWMGLADRKTELERAMAEAAGGGRAPSAASEKAYFWAPAADVLETPEAFVIMVELPGVEREAVAIEIKTRTLWVYGERPVAGAGGHECAYHSMERAHGPFARRFTLPKGVDRSGVRAVFKNGVLSITLPKECPENRCRRIPIS